MGLLDKVFGTSKSAAAEGEKMDSISDQGGDEIALIAYVKKKVEEVRQTSSRISHEGIWMTNTAYLLGFDSVYYDTSTRQFRVVGRPNQSLKRNRVHVNKILPIAQNRLARLCKTPPKYDVRPNSSNTEDKEAARLALQVINMVWDREKINQKRIPLYMWVQQCGHAYIKLSWDSQKGAPMLDPTTDEMSYEGDITVGVVSPFEMFPDPLAKTLDEAKWIVQAKVRTLDYFKTHYPERGHLVKEEGAWLLSAQYEARINAINVQGPTQSSVSTQMKNSAIELAYYERRSEKHPNGRLIICANGVLLEDKDLPCGEIPFVKFDDIIVAGKYYSESIVTHLRPLQDQFNRTISKRSDWTNKLLNGKIIAARGSAIQQEAMNDQSGEIVYYTPVPNAPNGGAPTALQMPVIPAYAYNEERSLEMMMDDIAGINQASSGQMPSASIPAVGMSLLQEADETRLGVTIMAMEEAWAQVGQLIVKFAEEYYKMPKILKVAGRNLDYTVNSFVGQDIRGNNDVIVIPGSSLPQNKNLKRQEVINAYNMGLLGDPADVKVREKVLGMLEYGDVAEAWLDYGLDMKQIREGIEMIEGGEMPPIHEADNHTLWLQELNRYRKGDKYKTLNGALQNLVNACMELHIEAMMPTPPDPPIVTPPPGLALDPQPTDPGAIPQ